MAALALANKPSPRKAAVVATPRANVLALRARDPWREATDKARGVALQRETVVLYLQALVDTGVSQNNAIAVTLDRAAAGLLPRAVAAALVATAKGGKAAPSRSALCDWIASYRAERGPAGLLPEHKGRVVESPAWWGPAIEYFNNPSKPDIAAVHRRLAEVDGHACTYDQVRHYLNGVPAMTGRHSPARLGKNLYRLTEKAFVKRSTQNALAGDVYVADGYRADVYLAHPVTGDLFRPELTVSMDMRSRFIVGWRADEHEGTVAVQNMWAETFARWGHVPPFLYVDNGSGYKNWLMDNDICGFYQRAGVQQIIHAIPGNPHGKGWIERFFRTMKEDFLKLWQPAFYCGHEMADEVRNEVVREIKAGRLSPPTMAQFSDAFNAWLDRYHARPHPEDASVTRAQVWAGLVPIPPHATERELKRQAVQLTVRRASLTHGKCVYKHADLHAWNHTKVVLEYDLMDNAVAIIRTLDGRWICDAHLVAAIDVMGTRLDEKREMRAADAIKRLEKKIAEQQARAGLVLDADAVARNTIDAPDSLLLDAPDTPDTPLILDLNIT
ncbi:Mu transposase C-terminal domain-containing protein [Zoogloea sp.]|uniref:Mu transposase C-terminal domain-containing protein n=1 Tax=Zoogloea sp. TaxID=49181 RepID=UPI002619563D|nr:Mu transposase C-terminal domain-containing protein [Zoogloea sp.]